MEILEISEIIGIISFALSGFLVAGSAKLDMLGIFIASFLTALGGGVIRDIIADKTLYAFSGNIASTLVIVIVAIASVFKINRYGSIEKNRFFLFADSLGLVSFAISGALVAIEAGFNFFGVTLLSLITAVGGGVLRDMLINRIPLILTGEFYGSVAIVIGILIYILKKSGYLGVFSIIAVFCIGLVLRVIAIKLKWQLPKV